MSTEIELNQDVKDLIDTIISEQKLSKDSHVIWTKGSELGDGFLSNNLAVSISDDNRSLELFLKCGTDINPTTAMPVDIYYANEINFYKLIYPTYSQFVEVKNIEDGFKNIAKCYGTSDKRIIALENIKKKGYTLCNKKKPLNDEHLCLVLQTFAKFHAISFAFKDQKREEYDKLIKKAVVSLTNFKDSPMIQILKNNINNFLSKLDPINNKYILDGTDNLANKLTESVIEILTKVHEDSILTQGDCWCNNMMFLYEDKNKEHPVDVILVDWQIIRQALPVIDISYFFYTVASQDALDNFEYYLKVYHEELSRQIRKLGSDPDVLYPFTMMKKQWKEKSKFGLHMAFMLLRIMLSEKDEAIDLTGTDMETVEKDKFFPDMKAYDEYFGRMKILLKHMIDNKFI